MRFRPAEVHAQEDLGPVGGVGATGAGVDSEDGVALVVFAGELKLEFAPLKLALESR